MFPRTNVVQVGHQMADSLCASRLRRSSLRPSSQPWHSTRPGKSNCATEDGPCRRSASTNRQIRIIVESRTHLLDHRTAEDSRVHLCWRDEPFSKHRLASSRTSWLSSSLKIRRWLSGRLTSWWSRCCFSTNQIQKDHYR